MVRGSGITPAPAGSTVGLLSGLPSGRDHPRACGEHTLKVLAGQAQTGSPPRLRGALSDIALCDLVVRITPAPAGSTIHTLYLQEFMWDHPRACGEHSKN